MKKTKLCHPRQKEIRLKNMNNGLTLMEAYKLWKEHGGHAPAKPEARVPLTDIRRDS